MALHENWMEYSTKEINKIKRERCQKCKYVKRFGATNTAKISEGGQEKMIKNPNGQTLISVGQLYCDYLMITGHKRECRPENCTHYKEKK